MSKFQIPVKFDQPIAVAESGNLLEILGSDKVVKCEVTGPDYDAMVPVPDGSIFYLVWGQCYFATTAVAAKRSPRFTVAKKLPGIKSLENVWRQIGPLVPSSKILNFNFGPSVQNDNLSVDYINEYCCDRHVPSGPYLPGDEFHASLLNAQAGDSIILRLVLRETSYQR